jgi:hypothetical protein
MGLSTTREPTSCVAIQEFPSILLKLNIHYQIHKALHLPLSWATPIQSKPPHPVSTRSILMLSTQLQLGLPSGVLPLVFLPLAELGVSYLLSNHQWHRNEPHLKQLQQKDTISNKLIQESWCKVNVHHFTLYNVSTQVYSYSRLKYTYLWNELLIKWAAKKFLEWWYYTVMVGHMTTLIWSPSN